MNLFRKRRRLFTSLFAYQASNIKYELLGIFVFILLWIVGGWLFIEIPGREQFADFLPIPTLTALYHAVQDGRFWESVWASVKRISIGLTIAAAVGIPAGLFIGFFALFRKLTYVPIQFLRMISPLSWMPVALFVSFESAIFFLIFIALIVFVSFESAIFFLIFIATVWPIILNTASGVTAIDAKWIAMAQNQGANRAQLFKTIVIPASLPTILSSLRMALGVAWIVLVPAEFLGVSNGLGYLINDARDTLAYDMLMAMIVAIGILGFLLDNLFYMVQMVIVRSWQ